MQYQNRAPRTAWDDQPPDRPSQTIEIIDARMHRPGAPSGRDSRRQVIDRAISAVTAQFVESLALYAASMQPQFFLPAVEHPDAADESPHGPPPHSGRANPAFLLREWTARPRCDAGAHRALAASQGSDSVAFGLGSAKAPVDVTQGKSNWPTRLAAGLWSRWLQERRIRRSRAALEALDERTLKDIGISRHEIDRVVRHGRGRH